MIRNYDCARKKVEFQAAIWKSMNLVFHTLVAADMNGGFGPPLGYGQDQEGHAFFGEG